MTTLPQCRHRGAEVGVGQYACGSNLVVHRGGLATAHFCAAVCPFVDRPNYAPPKKTEPAACTHRGPLLRLQKCRTCPANGGVVEVFGCALSVIGECTIFPSAATRNGEIINPCSLCEHRHEPGTPEPEQPPGPIVAGTHQEPPRTMRRPDRPTKAKPARRMLVSANGNSGDCLRNLWLGQSVFLVLGGPSNETAPLHLLNQRGIAVATCNQVAAKLVRPNFAFFVDDPGRFHEVIWRDPAIYKFTKRVWSHKHLRRKVDGKFQRHELQTRHCPNTWFYRHVFGWKPARFFEQDAPTWGGRFRLPNGQNRDTFSVMLPTIRILHWLGFRTIHLVGADFEMRPEKPYGFEQIREAATCGSNNTTYGVLRQWLGELRPHAEAAGLTILNCTEGSKLDAFDRMPLAEAVERVLETFPREIDTNGFYG